MDIKKQIQEEITIVIEQKYQLKNMLLEVQQNKSSFEGDFVVVIFPLIKLLNKNPNQIGEEIGKSLLDKNPNIESYQIVKGFLNISMKNSFFIEQLRNIDEYIENIPQKNQTIMVEYSSPNTNKPLHLGHVRNILLGHSLSRILKTAGYNVIKTQIINDRGIHICKSMLAWKKFGNGESPENTGIKGDKLVGNYYVRFDKEYKDQIAELKSNGVTEEQAKKEAPIILEAQKMLKDWENEDEKVHNLWKMMNEWTYRGFDETYKRLGVDFDQRQYESKTYLLGKNIIMDGLKDGVFYKKDDGSVWVDLSDEGLDQKILLRSDGTSVYITQDLGTAVERFKENDIQRLIYTVGNEQDYHFEVLFKILRKLGYSWAESLYHLSYGMVELPHGKMKSREGTVVDADDLMQEMYLTAKEKAEELGKMENLSDEEKEKSYEIIGLGALKYYILRVDPKKKILFNPEESIDFNGNTGPFIQYTYARIQSLLKKSKYKESAISEEYKLNSSEKELLLHILQFKDALYKAAENLSPAQIANYLYEFVKSYNYFYQNNPILNQDNEYLRDFRLKISLETGKIIKKSLNILGIDTVNRM